MARGPKCFSIDICKLSMSKDPVGGSTLRAGSSSDMVISSSRRSRLMFIIIRID